MPSQLSSPVGVSGSLPEQPVPGHRPQKRERWFDLLSETSSTAIGVISALENRYILANAAMTELYGMPLEELLDADPFSLALRLTHPEDLVAEQKLFAELVAGARGTYRFEKRFCRPDGTVRWGILTMSALFEPPTDPAVPVGPLSEVTLQIVETTERKALEAALERREAELRHAQRVDVLGRLSAGIAHDFNNLLTVITGHGQALRETLTRSTGVRSALDSTESVQAILAASERAAGLTAQLLAHGRRASSAPRAFVLSELTGSLQRMLSRTLGDNVEIEHSLAATGAIFADEGHMSQVVMNLVLNARDALSDGGRIRVETRDLSVRDEGDSSGVRGPGEWVALIVSDNGHGMTEEVKARMFEPFFTTREDRPGLQGNGLGLATVQRIVAEARGQITVESAPGRGTTVSIFLPRVAPPAENPPCASPTQHGPAPNSRRVLVVEDEPSVRSLVATVLLGAHYRVAVARHGEEALCMLDRETEPFHLVVTDLIMPRMGGTEFARTLHGRGDSPRMLFISGNADHTAGDLRPFGSLLPKPFTPAQLLSAVADALAG